MTGPTATAATLTPVPAEAQRSALALHAAGDDTRAIKALRKDTLLALEHGPAALAALVGEGSLPATPAEAAARLARCDPALHAELLGLLSAGEREEAIRHLRRATGLDLAGAGQLIGHLS